MNLDFQDCLLRKYHLHSFPGQRKNRFTIMIFVKKWTVSREFNYHVNYLTKHINFFTRSFLAHQFLKRVDVFPIPLFALLSRFAYSMGAGHTLIQSH